MTQSPSSVRDSEEGASGGSRAGKALLRSQPYSWSWRTVLMFPMGPVEFGMREMQAHASCSSNTFCGGAWTHLPGVPLSSQQCGGQAPPGGLCGELGFQLSEEIHSLLFHGRGLEVVGRWGAGLRVLVLEQTVKWGSSWAGCLSTATGRTLAWG